MQKPNANFTADAHFRCSPEFLPQVHRVARERGMTAASFMRAAVIQELDRAKNEARK